MMAFSKVNKEDDMEIGVAIKRYRDKANVSLRDFAAKCGTSHSYIAMLETGKNSKTGEPIVPSITMLKKIAHGMDMSVNDLITFCDDMPVKMQPPEFKLNYFDSTQEDVSTNLQLFGNSEQLPEKEKKLLALYNKIEDKEGFIRFTERLSALSAEQQKFVFDNLLQGQ
jgi:transcriptional regulator with XRE-family HTH domain